MSEITDHDKEMRQDADTGVEREEATGAPASGEASGAPTSGETTVTADGAADQGTGDEQEADVLRSELMRLQEELHEAGARADEMKDRYLRARAELENYRKRAALEADRAREAGLDSAVLPVLSVFDDLKRALEAAEGADPASIVPGVQSVLSSLERNLDSLGIEAVGKVGDTFDPDLHEALTTVPTDEAGKSETIAEVYQTGFRKGERLIRPARVVVYQS